MRSGLRRSLRFVRAGDEIAELLVVRRRPRRRASTSTAIEMVDQALAAVAVVLQPLVEAFLLEDDAVVNAGDVAVGRRFAGRGPSGDTPLRGG